VKKVTWLLCFVFVLSMVSMAFASEDHDIKWGADVSEFKNLTLSHEADGIKYYAVSGETVCEISNVAVAKITYAFKGDKLYARIIDIDNAPDFEKVHNHFMKTFGKATAKQEGNWEIRKWTDGDVKIKLKDNKKENKVKFGMYYQKL